MLNKLFPSQNQKLVKKWLKEHQEIVKLAQKVITSYSNNNHKETKKTLKSLHTLAVDHVMNEDIEFYRLLKDQKRLTHQTEEFVNEFTQTFKGTKLTLMHFLTKYADSQIALDDTFFRNFNEIVAVLAERIAFEEANLYTILSAKG